MQDILTLHSILLIINSFTEHHQHSCYDESNSLIAFGGHFSSIKKATDDAWVTDWLLIGSTEAQCKCYDLQGELLQ